MSGRGEEPIGYAQAERKKNMKSCFLAESKDTLNNVYHPDTKDRIHADLGPADPKVYRKEDVLEDPSAFSETEYIFSTWTMPQFTEDEIRACFPKLKAVLYAAGSVQAFAKPFLNCGVHVFSAWAANAVPVAETVLALILLANKGYHMASYYCSQSAELRGRSEEYVRKNRGNYGCKVGILGAGMIGSRVCQFLKNHRLQVLVYDPFCSEEKARDLSVKLTSLEEIFSECEVISNHLANNEQTRNILNYDLFKRMHDNATFINTGRGAQVVEEDLVRALKEKSHCCAILDVTEPEPPRADSPFFGMDNVILTPHLAGSQRDEWWRMAEYMYEEATLLEQGKPTRYHVTLKMLETMA